MQQVSIPSVEQLRKLKGHADKLKLTEENSQERVALVTRHDPIKRTFDLLFSAAFLIIFSPLFFILALLVGLTSPGSIFFKSRRLGRGGKIIECLKFRTMYKDAEVRLHQLLQSDPAFRAEWDAFQKVKLDPRITPIGRFLRRTSLDEIPQFWNVLKGDLSVVGPRPPTLLGPPGKFSQ